MVRKFLARFSDHNLARWQTILLVLAITFLSGLLVSISIQAASPALQQSISSKGYPVLNSAGESAHAPEDIDLDIGEEEFETPTMEGWTHVAEVTPCPTHSAFLPMIARGSVAKATSTATPTNTPTATATSTATPTNTPTATATSTATPTNTPAPDFELAAQPVTQTIARGRSITYTVSVTAVNGFSQPVTLEVGSTPSDTAVSWATNPLMPSANTTLSITPSVCSPTGTFTLVITGTSNPVHTTQVELIVTTDPKEWNVPCLVVVGQHQPPTYRLPPVLVGCVAGTPSIIWRYDERGAFIGFDLTIEDNGMVIYEASIDIERDQVGRIVSYGGLVTGDGFPDFTQYVVNQYNPQGGLIGADVEKVYVASGDRYEMEITQFCPLPVGSMTGYKVQLCDQEITIGICP